MKVSELLNEKKILKRHINEYSKIAGAILRYADLKKYLEKHNVALPAKYYTMSYDELIQERHTIKETSMVMFVKPMVEINIELDKLRKPSKHLKNL